MDEESRCENQEGIECWLRSFDGVVYVSYLLFVLNLRQKSLLPVHSSKMSDLTTCLQLQVVALWQHEVRAALTTYMMLACARKAYCCKKYLTMELGHHLTGSTLHKLTAVFAQLFVN